MHRITECGVLLAVFLVLAPTALGAVYCVDCKGGADFLTVQEAVDAAASGDTILIAPCVYSEQLSIADKDLTILGSGSESAELQWSGPGATVEADLLSAEDGLLIADLSVARIPQTQLAISWVGGELSLTDCVVTGRVTSGPEMYPNCCVTLERCALTPRLSVIGGQRTSTIDACRVGSATFVGVYLGPHHSLQSSSSSIEQLFLEMCDAHSVADSIGTVELSGDLDRWDSLDAQGSTIEEIIADRCAGLRLRECFIGDVNYYWEYGGEPDLLTTQCLVSGDVIIAWGLGSVSGGRRGAARRNGYPIGIGLEHNTILGGLNYDLGTDLCWFEERYIRSNIVVGPTAISAGDCIVISHNDFVGGALIATPSDSVMGNLEADPLFCGASEDDYSLQECSPCVGAAHDGGDIGTFGVGCECQVAVEPTTWGRIKSMFGGAERRN